MPLASSPIAVKGRMPKALMEAEVVDIVMEFKESARRAIEEEFNIIEIHAAHVSNDTKVPTL